MAEILSPSIRGLTYPLTIVNGNLGVSTDLALIQQQIRSVIETRYYERVMRADYGIGDYVLEVMNPGLINSAIQTAISDNVSNLSALSVRGDWQTSGESGLYKILIEYEVNGIPQPPLRFTLAG